MQTVKEETKEFLGVLLLATLQVPVSMTFQTSKWLVFPTFMCSNRVVPRRPSNLSRASYTVLGSKNAPYCSSTSFLSFFLRASAEAAESMVLNSSIKSSLVILVPTIPWNEEGRLTWHQEDVSRC